MEIIPVIYILDGRCVALYKGSYEQKETYSGTPLGKAGEFEQQGAEKIYLSDLNGLRDKSFTQKEVIREILDTVKVPVLVESGFIDMESMKEAMDMGADQVVLRSTKIELVKEAIQAFDAEKIMVQIYANRAELIEDRVKKSADDFIEVVDFAEQLVNLGVKYVMYKDKRSEGILTNPNYDEIDRLYLTTGRDLKIYSSGGISEKHHLKLLKKIGASGAMIGKAFFERMITIEEAKSAVAD